MLQKIDNFINKNKWIFVVALLIFIYLCLSKCSNDQEEIKSLNNFINSQKDSIIRFKDDKGNLVAQISAAKIDSKSWQTIVENDKRLIEELKNANIKAKNASNVINTVSTISVPTMTLTLTDTLKVHDTVNKTVYFQKIDKDISLIGSVEKNQIDFQHISFTDSASIIVGEERKNIFSKKKYVVSIDHTNKYVNTTNLSDYTIIPHQQIYDKTWFKIGLGVVGGLFIAHELK